VKIIQKNYKKGGTQKNFYKLSDLEYVRCLYCETDKYYDIHKEFGNIGIVKCANCNLIYSNPRPKNVEKNYHGEIDSYREEYKYIFDKSKNHHRDRNYIQEIDLIKKYHNKGKLVDVGCNAGRFLDLTVKSGFDSIGIEPSKSLADLGKKEFNLNIQNCTLEDSDLVDNTIDVITAIDVFEHLTNPKTFLKKSYDLLNEKGILVIKVPNGNYCLKKLRIAKLLKKDSSKLDIFDSYEHVVHHTVDSMKKMIESNKFKIINIFAPLPINPPVWSKHIGQYYLHPSPWYWDWKKIILRKIFHFIGRIEVFFNITPNYQADLLYIIKKK